MISLDDTCFQNVSPKKKKEEQMRTDTYISAPISISAPEARDEAKSYLDQRIYGIFYDKKEGLAKKFLCGDFPATYGEAREWIKEGKFKVSLDTNHKDESEFNQYDWTFRWGLKERDEKGYDLAMVDLKKARQDCVDIVSTQSDETKRLDALKAFDSYTQS